MRTLLLATCVLLLLAAPVWAQQAAPDTTTAGSAAAAGPKATSLDELLKRVQQGHARQSTQLNERETMFRQARDQQKKLLEEVRKQVATAESQSERLERTFGEKELRITDVTEQLNRRMGSFKELFGVLQQVSGDAHGMFTNSVISTQIPHRGDFLLELNKKLESPSALPSIEEIERVWFLLQQEMTESGRVVRFPATVIASDGRQLQEDVIRVGAFNVVAPGKYLQFSPETQNLSELGRQPQSRYRKTTGNMFEASTGSVVFGLDPTRGQILLTYLDRPGLVERIRQGGLIGYSILVLGAIGFLLAFERLIILDLASRRVTAQMNKRTPQANNPLGRVLLVAEENGTADVETLELKLAEAVLKETPGLTRAVLMLKIIGVVAPLLGLLGTVTGMIVTFQAITLFGTGDPKLMAGGISQALVTTVLGLMVAIPMVLLHTLVSGRSRKIQHVLQEQSAGIVAERSRVGA